MLGGQDPELNASEMVLRLGRGNGIRQLLKHLENPDWDVIVFDTAQLDIPYVSLHYLKSLRNGQTKLSACRLTGGIRANVWCQEGEKMREELEVRRRVLHQKDLVQSK